MQESSPTITRSSQEAIPKNRLAEGLVVRQAHHKRLGSVRPEPVEGRSQARFEFWDCFRGGLLVP